MTNRKPLTDAQGPVRELSAADFTAMRPFSALPAGLQAKLASRGLQKKPLKIATTIRLSADVVQAFRAAGDGWQTKIDAALKDWLRTHSPT